MNVMQIYRESNLKLIATTLLILKGSKLNFNNTIFKKFRNMGFNIGAEIGIWKYGYEAIRVMKWLLVDRYYDNIKYFDLNYSIIMRKTSELFSIVKDLTQ